MKNNDSICTKNKYCRFDPTFIDGRVQVERCEFCHKRVVYKLSPKGEVFDSMKYRRDHVRDSAQPFGATRRIFYEVYGEEPVKNLEAYMADKRKNESNKKAFEESWDELVRWTTSTTTTMK